jgi:hypothetical protein
MRRLLVLGMLVLASCTSNGSQAVTTTPTSNPSPLPSPSATPSLSPSKPPEPSLKDTRLAGLYVGSATVLSTNVNYGSDSPSGPERWVFKPRCPQGACDVLLTSTSGDFKVRLALVGNRYVGQVRRNNIYTCGDGADTVNNDANENIRLTPLASKYIGDEWLITKLKGLLVYDQATSNGICTAAHERFSVTVKRHFR